MTSKIIWHLIHTDNNSVSRVVKSFETIKQYEQRINLAQNDIKLYEELLQLNQEEYAAGFKAIEDVDTLKNSKEIRNLDIEKYKLNIKKEILFLYFQMG